MLEATNRMEYKWPFRILAVLNRYFQRVYAIDSLQVVQELMPDYLFRVGICYKAQVKPSLIGSDVSYIANPYLFSPIDVYVFDQITMLVKLMI